uniref:33 kDa inner dynein arm light chain, axonemal n=1 Tax=Cacopsylla melanoneura TaxID=428564 RepID=A0A8D9B3J3_9HEMI
MGDAKLIDPQNTMVRYSNPVVITKREDKGAAAKAKSPALMLAAEKGKETEEILNSILPPIEWEEDGQLWRLQVSSDPATRLDVIKLNEQLDTRLQQRQAREAGICPVRRELFTQCFDELIRQAAINCGERGLLLLRVRDEFRQTIAGYQALYESSIAFGMRKALQAEQGKYDMEEEIGKLRSDKVKLEQKLVEMKNKMEQIERRAEELRASEEKKNMDEIMLLKRNNAQLRSQLEGIIAPKK